jgi:nicotinamide mononucleotide transporter
MGVSYFEYQLYMDSGLNFFYVIMGVIGWLNWGQSGGNPVISTNTVRFHLIAIFILLALSAVIGQLLQTYSQAALPFWDAGTTLFSIWATYLLIKHKKENWLYWIVTDGIYVGLYIYKGAYLFAILFVIYTVLSVKGWRDWSKETAYIE